VTAWKDNAADVVNIKIGKFGGITKAKRVRNQFYNIVFEVPMAIL
jgi:L-alanine-DL-glutamate epimerase-like enolase superfamily enzyme